MVLSWFRSRKNERIKSELEKLIKEGEELLVRGSLLARLSQLESACKIAEQAMSDEWLYQTGQFCRPEHEYPPPGTVHAGLMDAIKIINETLEFCERESLFIAERKK